MRYKWLSRLILVGIGILLIGLALLAPSLKIVGVEPVSVGQVLILSLGLMLIVIGARDAEQMGPTINRIYSMIAVLLLNTIVMLVVIELIAIIGWNALVRNIPESQIISEARDIPYYHSVPWGQQYWEEFERVNTELYAPFLVWKRVSFQGETIHIDENGLRQTPGTECSEDAYRVFTFGGSTLWGYGAPDNMTIAAYLQQKLAQQRETDVCVTNFGELGYVSTQEVIRLMLELQKNHTPDLVIFYDGLNDVYAAYQTGIPGTHQNLTAIRARFEGSTVHPVLQWVRQSYTMRLLGLVIGAQPAASQTASNTDLPGEIMAAYNGNRTLVAGLAEAYGFEYLFFWQPIIGTTQKDMSEEERKIIAALDPSLLALYRDVYARAARIDDEHFHDLVGILDQQTEQIWFDSAHITPPGNEIIAEHIVNIINSQE